MRNLFGLTAVAVAAMTLAGAAQAVVSPLEGRTITGVAVASNDASAVFEYDPNLNITWLRDWGMTGAVDWNTAMNWASTLTVGTFSGWLLPSALNRDGSGPCSGFNCTGSQLGYVYYTELGKLGGVPEPTMSHIEPFTNMRPFAYWSSTEYASDGSKAWEFLTFVGVQTHDAKIGVAFAEAVRPGDVLAVPEPQTMTMMIAGLGVLAGAVRRRVPRR